MNGVELSEVIRNYAIVLAGAVGLGLAVWRSIAADRQSKASLRNAEVAQRSHVNEVFTSAVALLDDDKLEIRLGSIYSLRTIANDYPLFGEQIYALLQAYVRERTTGDEENEPSMDVRVIMEMLHEQLR